MVGSRICMLYWWGVDLGFSIHSKVVIAHPSFLYPGHVSQSLPKRLTEFAYDMERPPETVENSYITQNGCRWNGNVVTSTYIVTGCFECCLKTYNLVSEFGGCKINRLEMPCFNDRVTPQSSSVRKSSDPEISMYSNSNGGLNDMRTLVTEAGIWGMHK